MHDFSLSLTIYCKKLVPESTYYMIKKSIWTMIVDDTYLVLKVHNRKKILLITRPFQPMPVLLLRQKTLTLTRISLTIWHTANVLRSLERPLRTVLSICTLLSLSTASLVFQSSIGKSFRNWHTNVYLSLGRLNSQRQVIIRLYDDTLFLVKFSPVCLFFVAVKRR